VRIVIISVEAEESSGKTTFAYTAPPKIVGFQFDLGHERAIYGGMYEKLFANSDILIVPYKEEKAPQALWKEHDITIYEMPTPVQLNTARVQGCRELWQYCIKLVNLALEDEAVRTLVFDTMTLARRTAVNAHLQRLQEDALDSSGRVRQGATFRRQLLQIEYGAPNSDIRGIYSAVKGRKRNMVTLHHLTDERKGDVPTGKRVLDGLSDTYDFVDISTRFSKNSGHIKAVTKKVGYDLSLEGMELVDPTWDSFVSLVNYKLHGRIAIDRRFPEEEESS
jgi:hypothetical protein